MPDCVIVEPIPLATIPTDGIHRIEIKGNQALFVFYESQHSEFDDTTEHRIVAKMLIAIEKIPECVRQTLEAVADHKDNLFSRKMEIAFQMH